MKVRKLYDLDEEVIERLEQKAEKAKKGRKRYALKNYVEEELTKISKK